MRKGIAKFWVEKLRDPNTKQGTNRLCNQDGSKCCLGVLCTVMGREFQRIQINGEGSFGIPVFNKKYTYITHEFSILPANIAKEVGMRTQTGSFHYYPIDNKRYPKGIIIDLAELNDSGFTFSQIADIIEYFSDEL